MAAAVVEVYLGITGLTLTVDLYPLGSDTVGASGIALTEATNRKGLYTGTTAAALAGEFQAFIKTGTTVVGLGYVVMSDDTAVHRVVDNAAVFDKTGTSANVGGGTVTTLTNLPAIPTDWLAAGGVKADAVTKIQSGLSTYAGGDTPGTTTLLARLPATFFAGITSLAKWLGIIAGKTADAGTLAEVNATPAGVGYDNTADSEEAIRDRGDSAWITATGFSTFNQELTGVFLTAAGLDGITIEAGLNARQALSIAAAAVAGVLAGAATATITISAAGVAVTNRITATTDASGNRTVVTLSPPA
jgi:hypothetical protein